jgi:hypothetical protein
MADVEAGGVTLADDETILLASAGRGEAYGGQFVFQAAPNGWPNWRGRVIDGVRGLGARSGNGLVGWGGKTSGNGMVGFGGDSGGGVIGFGGPSGPASPAGSGGGVGVFGVSGGVAAGVVGTSAAAGGQAGVLGSNSVATGVAFGVYGRCDSGRGAGVHGRNANASGGEGVSGFADFGTGVVGRSGGRNGIGVMGDGTGAGVVGVSRGSGVAGFFFGDVTVTGSLNLMGAVNKSVAVRVRDGSYRRLYSMESPESWFEDFGEGSLQRGRATVRLPADFAPLIRTTQYHVFVTPYGNCGGLFVSNRTRTQFEVRELNGGKSSVRFSYRIVAKRKDIAGKRLEQVRLPKLPQLSRTDVGPVAIGQNDPLRRLRTPDRPRPPRGISHRVRSK